MVEGTIPILRIGAALVTTISVELRDDVAEAFQKDVLRSIERSGTTGLIIDVSGLDMVDTYVARILAETGQMARLMGTDTLLVGMRPEVAATLVRMGYPMEEVRTALNLELALKVLDELRRAR
jgi:rsbT antagonist protein RsbS